jgi:hypothetical protein
LVAKGFPKKRVDTGSFTRLRVEASVDLEERRFSEHRRVIQGLQPEAANSWSRGDARLQVEMKQNELKELGGP